MRSVRLGLLGFFLITSLVSAQSGPIYINGNNVGIGTSAPIGTLTLGDLKPLYFTDAAGIRDAFFIRQLDSSNLGFGYLRATDRAVIVSHEFNNMQTLSPDGQYNWPSYSFVSDPHTGMYRYGANTLSFTTAAIDRVIIDSAGNVGVGVVPDPWPSAFKALTMSGYGATIFASTSQPQMSLVTNAYLQNGWTYKSTNTASILSFEPGGTIFYAAPVGQAGQAINFTPVVLVNSKGTLDVFGNLRVGAPNPNDGTQHTGVVQAWQSTGASDMGNSVAGCHLELRGGIGTGTGANGDIRLVTEGGTDNWGNGVSHGSGTLRVIVKSNGNVGIGTSVPTEKLTVKGGILAAKVTIKAPDSIPDYVFEPGYRLVPLDEVSQYVRMNKHLPGIASESEIHKIDKVDLGEMQMKLLEKIEELTLYVIAQHEQIKVLQKRVQQLSQKP